MEKIRVYNPRKFAIGVILQNGAERAILPGSFALLSKDDIEYLASIAPALFEDENLLQIGDRTVAVDLGFIDSLEKPVLDADEIRRCLGQRISQVKAWLEGIEEEYLLDTICDVAAEMDLPASKLQLLKERMPEREFLAKE